MYKFNKILVGLDLTSKDDELIKAVCSICQVSGSKHIYFMNIIRDFHFPAEMLDEFPDLLDKALKDRHDQIQAKIKNEFECKDVKVHIVIKQGQPTKEFMKFANKNKIDLIVVGRKIGKSDGGILVTRLARRAGCSILVIPDGANFSLNRLHVPIDFSSYSRMAFEKALAIYRNAATKPKIIAQNVYQVPVGYHYTGKSFEDFSHIMRKHAEKDYHEFTAGLKLKDVDIETMYTLDKDDDVIAHIYQEAKNIKATVIMIGAKGRSAAASLFIGSKAEQLIQLNTDIPMMVIRPKGSGAGLIEFLKEL